MAVPLCSWIEQNGSVIAWFESELLDLVNSSAGVQNDTDILVITIPNISILRLN